MRVTRDQFRRKKGAKMLFVNTLTADHDWLCPISVGVARRSGEPVIVECGRDGSGQTVRLHLSRLDALTLLNKLRDAVAQLPED